MPIARVVGVAPTSAYEIYLPEAQAVGALAEGTVVAFVNLVGVLRAAPCGALSSQYPKAYAGVVAAACADGAAPRVIAGRGSLATPLVLGGGPLTVNLPVFLSTTAGYVTQTPPTGGQVVKVGVAISTTEICLVSEQGIGVP